jgi:hypothetical protein
MGVAALHRANAAVAMCVLKCAVHRAGSARSGAGNTSMEKSKRTQSIISEPAGVSMTVTKLLKQHAEASQLLTTYGDLSVQ